MIVTIILRNGNRLVGYSTITKRKRERLERELREEFGDMIVYLSFKEDKK